MKLHEFRLLIDTIDDNTSYDDYDVVVKISRPGKNIIGAVPTSSVKGVFPGFDWDTGKIIITTEDILTNMHSKTENSVLSATLTNNK